MTTLDPIEQVAAYAPVDDVDEWSRAALWERLRSELDTPPPVRISPARRRLVVAAGAAAALAAAAAVVVPAVLPAGAPDGPDRAAAAPALRRLAAAAVTQPWTGLRPGDYLHQVIRRRQTGPAAQSANEESWTDAAGTRWTDRTVRVGGTTEHSVNVEPAPQGTLVSGEPSLAFLRTLPTTPAALARYLRAHVPHAEDNTLDEVVFTATGDILRGSLAPPALRAAAVGVLADSPHVYLGRHTRDDLGRPVREFDYVDRVVRPGEVNALYLNAAAQLVQETDGTDDGVDYRSVVVRSETVRSVPAGIRRAARYHRPG